MNKTEEPGTDDRPPIRDLLVSAAFELFTERGYENTTIDDIVRLAGVGRRSFFRYFPTKEDVVFPDHEHALAEMVAYLQADHSGQDPVTTACGAARVVMRMYAENPTFSARRYALTRRVPALKTYEISVVWQYERTLAAYLGRSFSHLPDGGVRAYTVAAAVVAAHNYGLRTWLRSGATGDAAASVDPALDMVRRTFHEPEDAVVLIARTGTPLWQVVQKVETALKQDNSGS
ncbi:TetR family transcriptional regulator [Embleya scabrispora]|uniref:TetR family transcriptional regulator n=1 Tax=Embleya scabrispora TaxID=159449 RepID=UPI0003687C8C|nr:TetR family transcriptional regulator [Embleya scabrispora]MYS86661.1 TetR family transcriptional regulator [Streptomyces sp. SID5474]